MIKDIHFDRFFGPGWLTLEQLKPYFIAPAGKEWFYTGGNDNAGISLNRIDATKHPVTGPWQASLKLPISPLPLAA